MSAAGLRRLPPAALVPWGSALGCAVAAGLLVSLNLAGWAWVAGGFGLVALLAGPPAVWHAVWLARIPVFVVVAGVLLLTLPEQVKHMIAGATTRGQIAGMLLSVLATGLGCWFWCRWTLNFACAAGQCRMEDPGIRLLPRLAAAAPAAALLIAVARARTVLDYDDLGLLTAGSFAMMALLWWFAAWRRDALSRRQPGSRRSLTGLLVHDGRVERTGIAPAPESVLRRARAALPFVPWMVAVPPAVFLAAYVVALTWPTSGIAAAQWLGPIPVALLGLSAALTMLAPVLTVATARWRRSAVVIVAALAVGASGANVNTAIPAGASRPERPGRPTLEAAAAAWLEQRRTEQPEGPIPVMLVAAQGGASRAALWAASVVRALEENREGPRVDLRRNVFAVSGVSGGALGLGAVVASLAAGEPGCEARARPEDRHQAVLRGLERDHLAPALAGLLFSDAPWRLFGPVTALWKVAGLPEPLERTGWAMGSWTAGLPPLGCPLVASTFPSGSDLPRLPILFTSGTHVETGRLVVTSPVSGSVEDENGAAPIHPDAVDFVGLSGTDPTFAVAAGNSARFPFVAAPGLIVGKDRKIGYGQVVDGGYFDNLGTAALSDAAQAIETAAKARKVEVALFIVQIWSDPDRVRADIPRCGIPRPALVDNAEPGVSDSLLSPFGALINVRGQRANDGGTQLATRFCPPPGGEAGPRRYFAFAMGQGRSGVAPPLNWALPRRVQADIEAEELDGFPAQCNPDELRQLGAAWRAVTGPWVQPASTCISPR